jgi:hypothetical protein
MAGEHYAPNRHFRIQTVRGEPYHISGRKLTPLARVVSFGRARGTVGTRQLSGWGLGFSGIIPLAVLEESDGGEGRITVTDSTAAALRRMFAAAVALTVILVAIRCLVRARRLASALEARA